VRAVRRSADDAQRRGAHANSALDLDVDDWMRTFESFDRISIAAPSIERRHDGRRSPGLSATVELVNRPAV
jgi:hypothetical protein